ncbi:MAG TPA: maltose alpha-D-glucosyltransferase, partial [Terracidiphilus sp.]|nr:maltose alpha-D-glucosyltransferase [Terracidiphilus sp.]
MKKLASATDPLWYKDAIVYELHVRAFCDSNGDGIGDFPGLLTKLDYLQELGVTCIWLLPFFPSPLRDDGYDIANYMDVNPSYGTLDDFRAVLQAAHERNMQVMIELVINHTSDQHPWFKAARRAPAGSPEREMYVWSQTDQLYKDARIIFTDTEKSNWTWDETAKAYYWHRFFSHQPDLNFDNPHVIDEVLKAMRFWLDMGVDGLRMDAIPYLVERDGTSCENLGETHAVIRQLRKAIDSEYANRMILAEANQWPADVRPYFGEGDECHMAFHFPLMPRIYMALRQEDRLPITDIMAQTPPIPESCQWGLFLRNHDELTLEMVTDDERDYMYFAYSADPRMRVNVGIRRRLAPLLDNNRRRIELLNSLLLSFPGTPILYYGDELGMGDNIYLGDRNGVRTPMQWTSDRNAGFSRCDPARLFFPVIMDPIYGYQVVNVEAQLADRSSLLHWMRNMIALRKLFQVFGRGTLTFLNSGNRKILAYLRDLEHADGTHETVLCVANLSRFSQPVSLDLAAYAGMEPVEMLGYVPFPTITDAPYTLSLAPYAFLWLELQQASAVAVHVATKQRMEAAAQPASSEGVAAETVGRGWSGLIATSCRSTLETALSAWLPRQRWFGSKARRILATHILDRVELPSACATGSEEEAPISPSIFFVQVEFEDGPAETYQIPLAISTGAEGDEIASAHPQSVLTTFAFPLGPATVHDAMICEHFRQALRAAIASGSSFALACEGEEPLPALRGESTKEAEPPKTRSAQLQARASTAWTSNEKYDASPSHLGSAEQSNTSVLFGDQLIFKLFRRLQPGVNPDVEIGRFLTEEAHFPHIPQFLGSISIAQPGSEPTTLEMLQRLVPNEGDGWQWFLGRLSDWFSRVCGLPAPLPSDACLMFSVVGAQQQELPMAEDTLQAASLLGRRTAELHLALAILTPNNAFAAEPYTAEALGIDARQIQEQVRTTLHLLKEKLSTLEDGIADDAAALIARRLEMLGRAESIATLPAAGLRIRIHGDYHLGQTLRTHGVVGSRDAGDFVLIDFEGEPARPLSARRRKQSPLRDVAGMLRSFSYAAHAGLEAFRAANENVHPEAGKAWATAWKQAASSHFLSGYRETIAALPQLLPAPEHAQPLLEAFLLEKA